MGIPKMWSEKKINNLNDLQGEVPRSSISSLYGSAAECEHVIVDVDVSLTEKLCTDVSTSVASDIAGDNVAGKSTNTGG